MALAGGVLIGGVASTFFESMMWAITRQQATYFDFSRWIQNIPTSLLSAGLVILILGVPVWSVLHIGGFRTWLNMAIVGLAIPTSFLIYLINTHPTLNRIWHDPEAWDRHFGEISTGMLAFPLTGAVVALTIWRIAYRRPVTDV